MLWFYFMFNDLMCKVIVHFFDIGGIVDHNCLNFLFIIPCKKYTIKYILYIQIYEIHSKIL